MPSVCIQVLELKMKGKGPLRIETLGFVDYDTAMRIQLGERDRVMRGQSHGAVFLLEHDPPVITLGRNADFGNLRVTESEAAAAGYQVCRSSRGGDITVHEPGQLVAYFVMPVQSKSSSAVVESVLAIAKACVERYLPDVRYDSRMPRLWISDRKICSVGLDLTGGVSMHGVAINVSNDLKGFGMIVPCGLSGFGVTSISRELGRDVAVSEVKQEVSRLMGDTIDR